MSTKLDSEFKKAIKWIATEYYFFEELKKDLRNLKDDLSRAKEKSEVKDIKKAFRDFRYLSRAELRFNKIYEKEIEKEAEKMLENCPFSFSGTVKEIKELLARIHLETSNLIRSASRYEGQIKTHLRYLKEEIKDHEIEKAQANLMETSQLVEETENWVRGLSGDVQKAEEKIKDLPEEKAGRDIFWENGIIDAMNEVYFGYRGRPDFGKAYQNHHKHTEKDKEFVFSYLKELIKNKPKIITIKPKPVSPDRQLYGIFNPYADFCHEGYGVMGNHFGDTELGKLIIDRLKKTVFVGEGWAYNACTYIITSGLITDPKLKDYLKEYDWNNPKDLNGPIKKKIIELVKEYYKVK